MDITLDLLRINGFKPYEMNDSIFIFKSEKYKMSVYPMMNENSNRCVCNVELEYFDNPYKDQKMQINNIKTAHDLTRILKMFDIDKNIII